MPATTSRSFSPLLVVVFGAICISFAGVFVRLLDPESIGPTAIAFWRALIGAGILCLWAVLTRQSLWLPWPVMRWAIVAGFCFAVDLSVWHRSIIYCGVGMATLLGNTQVFGSAVLSWLIFKEKLTATFMIAAVSAMVGVALLVGLGSTEVTFTHRYLVGILLGLATGIAYANYIIALKKAGHQKVEPASLVLMFWASLSTAFFAGISAAFEPHPMLPPDLKSWALLGALALVAQAVGWRAISSSLPKLPVSRAGLALLMQPTMATVWGALFFAESLTPIQLLGAVITLAAIYFGTVRR